MSAAVSVKWYVSAEQLFTEFFFPLRPPVKWRAYKGITEAALIFAFGLIFLLMSRYSLHIRSASLPFTPPADSNFHRSCCFNEFKCVTWAQRRSWWSLYTSVCKSCMKKIQVSSSLLMLVFCWPSHLRPLALFSRLSSTQINNVLSRQKNADKLKDVCLPLRLCGTM